MMLARLLVHGPRFPRRSAGRTLPIAILCLAAACGDGPTRPEDGPPELSLAGDTVLETRDSLRLTVTVLDDYEVRRVLVDWGDATADSLFPAAPSATLAFAHLYADTGAVTVTAHATDDGGRTRDATHGLRVFRTDTLTMTFVDLQSGTDGETRQALSGVHVRVLEAPDSALVADTTVDASLSLVLPHGRYHVLPSHPAMLPELATLVWDTLAAWGEDGFGVSRAGAPVAVTHSGQTGLQVYLHDAATLPLDTIEWWGLWRSGDVAHRFEAGWTLWVDTGTVAWTGDALDRLPNLIELVHACQSMRVAHRIAFRDTVLARAPEYPAEVSAVVHVSAEGGYGFGESPDGIRTSGELGFEGSPSWPGTFGTLLYVLGAVNRFDYPYADLVEDDGTGRYVLSPRGATLCNAHGALPTGSVLR